MNKFVEDWLKPIGVAFLIFLFISIFFRIGEVDGESMYPTFSNGDKVIISKHHQELEVGDIVVFEYTENNEQFYQEYMLNNGDMYFASPSVAGEKHIKRVIGVPGDEIVIKDNEVYVNGALQVTSEEMDIYDQNYILQEGEYFLVGDNYNNSYDSRMHGPVMIEDIYGKLITTKE